MITERDRRLPIVVSGIGIEAKQPRIVREDGLNLHHLLFCTKGKGLLKIDGKEFIIKENDLFYFDPDIPHEYYPLEENWTTMWIVFEGYMAKSIMTSAYFGSYEFFSLSDTKLFVRGFNKIYKLNSEKPSDYILKSSSELYNLLIWLGCNSPHSGSERKDAAFKKLNKITDYIKSNYNRDISLDELADLADVSVSYLCRLFKKEYDMTIVEYILRIKTFEAKKMLISCPEKGIKWIAKEVGFNDLSYFGSVFKKSEGCTPKQFRQLYSGSISSK